MRRDSTPILIALLGAMVGLAWGSGKARGEGAGGGQGVDTGQVDSVLDRLEKRLLDQEADGLTYREKSPPPTTGEPTDGLTTTFRFEKAAKVEASAPGEASVQSVETMVADLEGKVDLLASAVQKTRQTVLDEARIDNYTTLEARLDDTDSAAIKTLTVKLDGYPVYDLSDAAGLWMPTKTVPLYSGPLQPGSHRLDLEARLVVRHEANMPLNSDLFRFVNKTFDLTVVAGTSNTHYVVTLTPPDKNGSQADAVLKESR